LGRAGHLGHVTVNFEGPKDIVGTPGSLEDAVGNATVAQRSNGRFQNTRVLLEAAQAGDPFAQEVWDRSTKALAAGMVSLINAFDPETFILGGGIAAGAWELLMAGIGPWLVEHEWRPTGSRVKVVQAQLGEWAGAYGAARSAAARVSPA
jgi:glucokinase